MLTREELQARKNGVFSTDAAAALGMSKYGSPVSVWMEKIGIDHDIDTESEEIDEKKHEQSEEMSMGLIMQPVIGRLYEDRTGSRLRNLDGVTMFSDTVKFMGSHFDFQVGNERRLVEAKNFNDIRKKEFGEPGTDDVPMDCLVQCLHEGFVFGADSVDLAVLFGGQKFEIYTIPVNKEAVDILIEKLSAFWHLVETKEPPAPQTQEDLKALFKRDDGSEVVASPEVERACIALSQIKDGIKKNKDLEQNLSTFIKSAIGDHAVLRSQSGLILATWKNSKETEFFDKKGFRDKNQNLYESFCSTKPGNRPFLLK
jgi:predicted phage-related endonuclease